MRKGHIQSIIFDFGNVLIGWDPHRLFNKYFSSDTAAIDRFLADINFKDWNLAQDKGYPFSLAVEEHAARFPQYEHLIRAYHEEWEQSITGPISETIEILSKLKESGYCLYGLTNWSAEKFAIIRPKYAFFGLFDEILVSGDVKLLKPDPEIFLLLLKMIRRQPEECLIIDDSPQNVETAQKMGFAICHFSTPKRLEADLKQLEIL